MRKQQILLLFLIAALMPLSLEGTVILTTSSTSSQLCGPNLADYRGLHSARVVTITTDDLNKTFMLDGALDEKIGSVVDIASACWRSVATSPTSRLSCVTTHTGRCTVTRVRARSIGQIDEPAPDSHQSSSPFRKHGNCTFEF